MKVINLLLLLVLSVNVCIAQSQRFLPVLAPPSPDVAAFARFGNYQVNLFTGLPDISIPIYQVNVGEMSVPISLNYHPSGIKVSDIPSRIGMGWDLQAGGAITRKIMGKPDELQNNYLSATSTSNNRVRTTLEINTNTEDGLDYLENVYQGRYDVEPDIFSYNFPGHGGKFLFNQKNNFSPVLIPYAPVSVSYANPLNNLDLAMTDENGINYQFGAKEWTTSSSGGVQTSCTSSWSMSEMISANKQDSIHFKYDTASTSYSYNTEYLTLTDNCTGIYNGCTNTGSFSTDAAWVSTNGVVIKEIQFPNGKIVFEAAAENRLDFSAPKRLNDIKIYNYDAVANAYILMRSVYFFHSYFSNRLRLDSVQFKSGLGAIVQTYKFDYSTSINLPSYTSTQKDYWGYFNNATNLDYNGNPTSIKRMQVQYNPPSPGTPYMVWIGGTNVNAREPDPNYMQACILQKITYPTGGYSQFEYETNQYLDDQNNPKYAGGLRIKSIKSYTSSTTAPIVKTYKYGKVQDDESGYGRANFFLEDHFFLTVQNFRTGRGLDQTGHCATEPNNKTVRTYFSNPTNDIESYDGAPVVYPFVTEYVGDGTTNSGKTTYTFSDRPDGRTDIIGLGKPVIASYHFVRGLLKNRSDYKKNPDNTYTLVAEDRKGYQYFPYASTTGGIALAVLKTLITTDGVGLNYCTSNFCDCWSDNNSFQYNNYEIQTGDNKLVADTAIAYQQNDPSKSIVTITNYTYDDPVHLNLTQVQATNSKNELLKTSYTYPYNYTTVCYPSMNAAHIWAKTVTETKFNGSTRLTQQTNNFACQGNNNYLPSNIVVQVKNNAAETRAYFNSYDARGNILEMQKASDVKLAFIYDYKNVNVIAEATNAAASDIAYTSFESNGKGNWIYTGYPFYDSYAPTGKRVYSLSNGYINKTGLDVSKTYIVSYWSKSGMQTVTGTSSSRTGPTYNGWTYYEHVLQSVNNIWVSGSGIIDELRIYPSTGQMKTYTYEPLVGLTSVCDINNRIIRYYYDGFGRLLIIKDDNGNILKKFCYNYLGQPGTCSIYGNTLQSGTYTKDDCPSGYSGSTVTYTVPANTYYASTQTDANTLALNDVNAKKRTYANANGTCSIPPITVTGSSYIIYPYVVRFTNVSTSNVYYMYLYPNSNSSTQMPPGTYNIDFYPYSGSTVYTTFYVNYYSSSGYGANFYNINIASGSWVRIGN